MAIFVEKGSVFGIEKLASYKVVYQPHATITASLKVITTPKKITQLNKS